MEPMSTLHLKPTRNDWGLFLHPRRLRRKLKPVQKWHVAPDASGVLLTDRDDAEHGKKRRLAAPESGNAGGTSRWQSCGQRETKCSCFLLMGLQLRWNGS